MGKLKTVKNGAIRVTNHVWNHKVTYALGTVTVVLAVANARNAKRFDAFMTSKGINPMEFWLTAEDFASLTQ